MDVEDDCARNWIVPRPTVRLWLALLLGVFAAVLFTDDQGNPFAHLDGTAAIAWITAVLAVVAVLHRAENANVPAYARVLIGLAAAVFTLLLFDVVDAKYAAWVRAVGVCVIGLLLFVAGASLAELHREGQSRLSWVNVFVRGPAVAATAPLLLFASRPVGAGRPCSRAGALSQAVFAVFPHLLAMGFTLLLYGDVVPRSLDLLRLACLSFSVWTWLSCALIFLLTGWPNEPHVPGADSIKSAVGFVTAGALVVMTIVIAAEVDLQALIVVVPAIVCGLVLLLISGLAWPGLPKLGELQRARRMSIVSLSAFFALIVVPLAGFTVSDDCPFFYVASGRLFTSGFSRDHVGSAMDQPTIGKWLILFTLFTAFVVMSVTVARWASNRDTPAGYWAFAIPTLALCFYAIVILTLPFWWLIQYIDAMGVTPRRIYGLLYGVAGYLSVLAFVYWALRRPTRTSKHIREYGTYP